MSLASKERFIWTWNDAVKSVWYFQYKWNYWIILSQIARSDELWQQQTMLPMKQSKEIKNFCIRLLAWDVHVSEF